MELIIYNPREGDFLQQIDWNFDELKNEITKKSQEYMDLVYSDDQIKEAKKDKANLNKLIKALEDKRKEIKKEVMVPYNDFEAKEKELVAIISKAVENIDGQVKSYEQALRDEKKKKVEQIYKECIRDLDRVIPFSKVFKESYLNAGTTLKSIREEMTALYEKVDKELKIINTDSSLFATSMKQEYLKNLDLGQAMAKKNELEEAEKLKAIEEERRKKEQEERERFIQEQAALFEREKAEQEKKTEPLPQAPEMPLGPMLSPEGNVSNLAPTERPTASLRKKRIVISITANETQFDYLNNALADLKANSEELKVLEKEAL